MSTIQIKNVPDDVHAVLRKRAAGSGQSLQEYLKERLVEDASTPTLDEVLDRAGGRAGGTLSLAESVDAVWNPPLRTTSVRSAGPLIFGEFEAG